MYTCDKTKGIPDISLSCVEGKNYRFIVRFFRAISSLVPIKGHHHFLYSAHIIGYRCNRKNTWQQQQQQKRESERE